MLRISYTTRFFILCATLTLAIPVFPEISPLTPNPALETPQQIQERAIQLNEFIKWFDQLFSKVKHNVSQTIHFTKKYGRDIDKDAVTNEMFKANDALDRFLQIKLRTIQPYLQQDFTAIPAEGYQEIYETLNAIVRAATRLMKELDVYVKSNFTQEFNFNFLISKDSISLIEENIAPETVLTRCTELDAAIEALIESGNEIGLTRWNRTARKIEKYVVRPCAKYHVPELALVSLFALPAITYLYWTKHCEQHETPHKKIDEMLRTETLKNDLKKNNDGSYERNPINDEIEKQANAKKQLSWLARKLQDILGKKFAISDDGSLTSVGMDQSEIKWWNSTVADIHNTMIHQPIPLLIQAGGAYLFNEYVVKQQVWPKVKTFIQTWWQHSLGGRHLEMQQKGNFEFPIEHTFDQVIGLEHIKAYFEPALAYATDPVKYANIGGSIVTNHIFYGVKRTGKSFFAVALAGEMKKRNPHMRILRIPCHLFKESVQQTIDLIRSYAPCVVFVDEIDIAGANRATDRNMTGELLKELGNGNISPAPDRPVFLIFATNKLEAIDSSLNSFGRFGPAIHFSIPSFHDRIQFVDAILRTDGYNPDNFEIYRLAERTEGCSFEDIKFCVSGAILKAGTYNVALTTDLIMDVMNEILNGIYPEYPYELNPDTLKVIATHYAGKALVSMLMPSHELLDTVTIHKRKLPLIEDEWAGYSGKPTRQKKYDYGMLITRQSTIVSTTGNPDKMVMTPELQKAYYMRQFAGSVAEELVLGMAVNKCEDEKMLRAYENFLEQCSDGGVAFYLGKFMSNEQQGEYFAKARTMVDEYKQEVRELLSKHRRALDVLVRALMSPALSGSVTDGIVSLIIENPDDVNAQLDAAEDAIQKQYEDYMKKQQEERDNLVKEDASDLVPDDKTSDELDIEEPMEAAMNMSADVVNPLGITLDPEIIDAIKREAMPIELAETPTEPIVQENNTADINALTELEETIKE